MLVEVTPVFPRAKEAPVTTKAAVSVAKAIGVFFLENTPNLDARLPLLIVIFLHLPRLSAYASCAVTKNEGASVAGDVVLVLMQ